MAGRLVWASSTGERDAQPGRGRLPACQPPPGVVRGRSTSGTRILPRRTSTVRSAPTNPSGPPRPGRAPVGAGAHGELMGQAAQPRKGDPGSGHDPNAGALTAALLRTMSRRCRVPGSERGDRARAGTGAVQAAGPAVRVSPSRPGRRSRSAGPDAAEQAERGLDRVDRRPAWTSQLPRPGGAPWRRRRRRDRTGDAAPIDHASWKFERAWQERAPSDRRRGAQGHHILRHPAVHPAGMRRTVTCGTADNCPADSPAFRRYSRLK